jgi:hypothetical protein
VAETNDPAPVAEPTAADRALDLRGHYAELERLRPQCDSEWCPFLNPTPEMDQWQGAIRRALHAEAALRAARETNARLNRRCQEAEAALGDLRRLETTTFRGSSIGRALLAYGLKREREEADALRARLAAAEGLLRRLLASAELHCHGTGEAEDAARAFLEDKADG